jgi:hypothetical protein
MKKAIRHGRNGQKHKYSFFLFEVHKIPFEIQSYLKRIAVTITGE